MNGTIRMHSANHGKFRTLAYRLIGCAAGAALVVSAAACSSSGTGSTSAATPGGSSSTGATQPISVTIGDTAIGAGYSDIYVGMDDGIFKAHGLNVTLKQLNSGSQLVPALTGGSVQIGVGPADTIATAILQGIDLKFVAMSEAHYNLQIWGDTSIKSAADLVGKTVAVSPPGSESYVALDDYLKAAGLKISDVKTAVITSVPGKLAALKSGAVNATLDQPPQGNSLAASGFHLIASLSNLPFGVGAYAVTSAYAQAHPDVMQRFAASEVAILKYLRSHSTQTITAIEKDSGESNPALAKYAYNFFLKVWTEDPTVQLPIIQGAFQRAAANTKKAVPSNLSQYILSQYVTAAMK